MTAEIRSSSTRRHQPGAGARSIGLNFAAALRSFLRQDPNIILVGEIRDFETGGDRGQGGAHRPPRALDAAHQRRAEHDQPLDEHGHRAVPRRELGASHLRAAPRAARLLRNCKEPHPHAPQALIQAGFSPEDAPTRDPMKGGGCERATNRLQRARRLVRSDGNRRGAARADSRRRLGLELRRKAIDEGMITLRQSGLRKVKDGMTTIEEVYGRQ
jgi:type IV pilus assembly protein PilB